MSSDRKLFTMTDAQFERLISASKPVAMIMLQCGAPSSPQQNANTAWQELGRELGFAWDTVRPHGGNQKQFTAEVTL